MRVASVVAGLTFAAAVAGPTYAGAAAETADAILRRRDEIISTSRRWTDRYRRLAVFGSAGSKRELEICDVKLARDAWKTVGIVTRGPSSLRGTAFFIDVAEGRPKERFLYQPQFRRVRRLLPDDPHQSFVDDLTVHDFIVLSRMESWTRTDVDARLLGEEPVDGEPTYVLQIATHARDIVYSRYVVHLTKNDLVERRIELYEDQDVPSRRIQFSDVRVVDGIPVPHRVEVETPEFGTRTDIRLVEVTFNRGLNKERFAPAYLEQGRCR